MKRPTTASPTPYACARALGDRADVRQVPARRSPPSATPPSAARARISRPSAVLVGEVPDPQRARLEADHDVVGEARDVGLAGLDAEIAHGDLPRRLVGSLRNERRPRSQLDPAVGRRAARRRGSTRARRSAGAAPSRRRRRSRLEAAVPPAVPHRRQQHLTVLRYVASTATRGCSSRSPRSAGSSPLAHRGDPTRRA